MKIAQNVALLNQVASTIHQGRNFLVTAHPGPDGDAIGCMVAMALVLQQLGRNVIAFNPDPVPRRYCFLYGTEHIRSQIGEENFDTTLVLDCSDNRMFAQMPIPRSRLGTIVIIDHHRTSGEMGDVIWRDPRAAAVGVLLHKLFRFMGIELSFAIAEALFCSVISDTGSFRYQNTNPEAMRVAADLLEVGIDPWRIASQLYEERPRREFELLASVLQTLKVSNHGRVASLTVTHQMLNSFGCDPEVIDGFINYARGIQGVEVAILLRPGPTGVRVSFRSSGKVNVAKIAEKYGGGGHHNAAGCRMNGELEQVESIIFDTVEHLFLSEPKTSDSSSPAIQAIVE